MIDVRNELARWRAMGSLRRRIGVQSRTYSAGEMHARVIIDRTYFDVSAAELRALETGASPVELGLEPAADQSD